jgi:hypothetical protein
MHKWLPVLVFLATASVPSLGSMAVELPLAADVSGAGSTVVLVGGMHGRHDPRRHERWNGWNVWWHERVWRCAGQQLGEHLRRSGSERRSRAACAILPLRHALRPLLAGLLPRLRSQRFSMHVFHRTSRHDQIAFLLVAQPGGRNYLATPGGRISFSPNISER